MPGQNFQVRLVRQYNPYDDINGSETLLNTTGKVALLAAKSILSTEIIKILQPLVGTKYSPNIICKDIMNAIELENFIGIKDTTVLESLLYNEFYKICMEIDTYNNINSTKDIPKALDKLRPILNSIVILLNRVNIR